MTSLLRRSLLNRGPLFFNFCRGSGPSKSKPKMDAKALAKRIAENEAKCEALRQKNEILRQYLTPPERPLTVLTPQVNIGKYDFL